MQLQLTINILSTEMTINVLSKRARMKIQTGNPARGDEYFIRENLIARAWELIESGSHILVVAPRRVGKTSLMYYLLDNSRDNYNFVYMDTESDNNENEFFRRIVNKLSKTNYIQKSKKAGLFLIKYIPAVKKLGPEGIEFGVKEKRDYKEILSNLLKSTKSEKKKLIIMLDEFPETLENIIEDEGDKSGRHFLQSNRELRQDDEISKNIQFIYTGSIGLEIIVGSLNSTKTINDLSRLKNPPLTTDEAKLLIVLLLKNVKFQLNESLIENILNKIEWLIPFYIQLVLDQLREIHREQSLSEITTETINQAFDKMLDQKNHFENWYDRLRKSLRTGNSFKFVKEILNITSENNNISSNEIFNLAVKYNLEENYIDVVKSLVYDGYINNDDDPKIYRYNSPILRMWWRKNVAN